MEWYGRVLFYVAYIQSGLAGEVSASTVKVLHFIECCCSSSYRDKVSTLEWLYLLIRYIAIITIILLAPVEDLNNLREIEIKVLGN